LLVASINTVVRGVDLMPSETEGLVPLNGNKNGNEWRTGLGLLQTSVMGIGKSWMKEHGTTGMAVARNDKMENESKKWPTHKWNDTKWWME
jgi:hypothetical protein